jgi:hypothetical protein
MPYQAIVEAVIGNRKVSNVMANAGLGVTGVGSVEVLTIDYKEGEVVDEERVSKAMDSMIIESDRLQTEFKIVSYKILSIRLK